MDQTSQFNSAKGKQESPQGQCHSHVIPTSCLLPFKVKIALIGVEGTVLTPIKGI